MIRKEIVVCFYPNKIQSKTFQKSKDNEVTLFRLFTIKNVLSFVVSHFHTFKSTQINLQIMILTRLAILIFWHPIFETNRMLMAPKTNKTTCSTNCESRNLEGKAKSENLSGRAYLSIKGNHVMTLHSLSGTSIWYPRIRLLLSLL